LRFTGSGKDQSHNEYRTLLIAKGEFKNESNSYDIPYRSLWVGRHGASSFSMDGTLRVFVQGGVPQGDGIVTYETDCRQGAKPEDIDDRDHDDHDGHRDRGHDSH
jgi:hypothetical protein